MARRAEDLDAVVGTTGARGDTTIALHEALGNVPRRLLETRCRGSCAYTALYRYRECGSTPKIREVQLPSGQRIVHHTSSVALGDSATTIRIGDLWVTIAANHYGFEAFALPLGAQAHALPPGKARSVTIPGESHLVLPGGPDVRDVDLVAQTRPQGTVDRLGDGTSPEIVGGNERGPVPSGIR